MSRVDQQFFGAAVLAGHKLYGRPLVLGGLPVIEVLFRCFAVGSIAEYPAASVISETRGN